MYTRGVRLRLALAFVLVVFNASAQPLPTPPPPPPVRVVQPKNTEPLRLSDVPHLPPLEHPVEITVASSIPAATSWLSGGPSFGEVPLGEKISLARAAAGPASFESREVLKTAVNSWQTYLRLDLQVPGASATLTRDGEDIAVASGELAPNASGFSHFLLWDEPVATSLLLQIPPSTLNNPAALETVLTDLFAWGGGQQLYSVNIVMSPNLPFDQEILRGHAWFNRVYQAYFGPDLTVSGAYDRAQPG